MKINQAIERALSDMVSGNIWPLSKPTEEDPDIFIVYNPENEYIDYGDDLDWDADLSMQVHWYAKGHANYLEPRRKIREALRDAGFLVEPSPFAAYEDGKSSGSTGWTHITIVCRTEEE